MKSRQWEWVRCFYGLQLLVTVMVHAWAVIEAFQWGWYPDTTLYTQTQTSERNNCSYFSFFLSLCVCRSMNHSVLELVFYLLLNPLFWKWDVEENTFEVLFEHNPASTHSPTMSFHESLSCMFTALVNIRHPNSCSQQHLFVSLDIS